MSQQLRTRTALPCRGLEFDSQRPHQPVTAVWHFSSGGHDASDLLGYLHAPWYIHILTGMDAHMNTIKANKFKKKKKS